MRLSASNKTSSGASVIQRRKSKLAFTDTNFRRKILTFGVDTPKSEFAANVDVKGYDLAVRDFTSVRCYLAQNLGLEEPWWQDLVSYYKVTPAQALALGTRQRGRRPDLPGSPTCQPVSGKTWEELWESRPRDSEEAIALFYQEIGAWACFRQVVRHRWRSWAFVARHLPPTGGTLLEYGCGVAAISFWVATHRPARWRWFHLVDVPSEHLTFGTWRLRKTGAQVGVQEVQPGCPPWIPATDVAVILETFEHLPAPLQAAQQVGRVLRRGGVLFEDFGPHDLPSGADLPQAQIERPEVYRFFAKDFLLEAGRPWTDLDGGGIRQWRKH